MIYLRVDCYVCGAYWNFYQEIISYPLAIQYQGCVCPRCGSISCIPCKVNGGVAS